MLERAWQSSMISLARSPGVKRLMQDNRAAAALARRYVAGPSPQDGVARSLDLLRVDGIRSSLFYLGEYVDRQELAAENIENKKAIIDALGNAEIDIHVSVDPTQIGHLLDPAQCKRTARSLAEQIRLKAGDRAGVHCLMLDMEDTNVTDATICLHDELRAAGLPVALTLQAYLRRTANDLERQIANGARVRLVKGAFAEGREKAFVQRNEIKENYGRLVERMFSADARVRGFYPIVATHDDRIQAFAAEQARASNWRQGDYEFEMLLGVRGDVAKLLAVQGERVRLYVPFGRDWWPHAARRIGERPSNAWLLGRALIS